MSCSCRSVPSWLIERESNIHACRASSDLPSLLHAVQFTPTVSLCLALHVIIVVGSTSGSNEVGCAKEGCGSCAYLLDLRDMVRHRSRVDENMLIEPDYYCQLLHVPESCFADILRSSGGHVCLFRAITDRPQPLSSRNLVRGARI